MILHPEEIQHLEFPKTAEPDFHVKEVVYKSDLSTYPSNGTILAQYSEATRFNLFTGEQTLQEREESFKVSYYGLNFHIEDEWNFSVTCPLIFFSDGFPFFITFANKFAIF